MSTGVAGEIKRAGGDAIEFAAVRQAPAAPRRRRRDARRPARRAGRHPRRLARARPPHERSGHRPRRPQRHGAGPRAGAHERRLPGARHGHRRVPARRGRAHRGDGRPRRAGRPRRIEHVVFALRGAPPTRRSPRALAAGEPRRPGRCSCPEAWRPVGPGLPASSAPGGAGQRRSRRELLRWSPSTSGARRSSRLSPARSGSGA